ncbi:MAG: hypothetical protein ACO3A4_10730 [Silvanigrellaceae bacterium]
MNESRFEITVLSMWKFLHRYYERAPHLEPLDFVVVANHENPRLLIDETSEKDSAFVSVEIPHRLKKTISTSAALAPQSLSVVCEEISHLFHYIHAAEIEASISSLELETLAEIDRFLCFMHWNDFFPALRMDVRFENCREICDALFENRSFKDGKEELYRNAESLAFHHIQRAFSHCWTNRWLDTTRFDTRAQKYFVDHSNARGRISLMSA